MKRLILLAALTLLLVMTLLATAGPALAGDPFAGYPPSYGWHESSSRAVWLADLDKTHSSFWVECTDPRGSGLLVATIKKWWVADDGYMHARGSYVLTNDGGYWTCPYWEHVFSSTGILEGDHSQGIALLPETHYGHDGYEGLVMILCGAHSGAGWGNGWISKGWFGEPAD